MKIVFQNIGTLKKYLSIIKNDLNYTSADVLAFVESRLSLDTSNCEIALNGFHEVIRNDLSERDGNGNATHGTALYVRNGFTIIFQKFHSTLSMEWSFLILTSPVQPNKQLQLAVVYIQPNCSKELIKSNLKTLMSFVNTNESYLVVGDFNINEYDYSNEVILQDISDITLSDQLVEQCTTENNTKIDLAYSNAASIGVISSMISYHSMITAQFACKSEVNESAMNKEDLLISFLDGKSSLDTNLENVCKDPFLRNSHVLGFCETNFNSEVEYDIPNFTDLSRKDGHGKTKLEGLAVYSQLELERLPTPSDDIILVKTKPSNDIIYSIFIAIVYRKKHKSIANILKSLEPIIQETLQNKPSVIMANFNMSSNNPILTQFFHPYRFVKAMNEVAETQNICFTNIKTFNAGIYEVVSLNRAAIWIKLPQNADFDWFSV
jgi:hypothetical protein